MNPTLPQNDPNPEARRAALAKAAEPYSYNYDALPPVALASQVPEDQEPTTEWKRIAAGKMVALAVNSAFVDRVEAKKHPDAHSALFDLLKETKRGMKAVLDELNTLIKMGESKGRPDSIQDYSNLFQSIDLPGISEDYQDDAIFAEQRLAGANPMWITQATELPDHFPVTDDQFQAAVGEGGHPRRGEERGASLPR